MTEGRGWFITLEGGEGGGKTTQLSRLAESLAARGVEVVTTREPGGAPGAEALRALLVAGDVNRWDPLTEVLLHYAARRNHLSETVWPALDAGKWVISDRFSDSTMAYQSYGQGVPRATVEDIHNLVVGDFTPDLTVILDLPVKAGLARAGHRNGEATDSGGTEDRYERMGADFHERLRDGFLDIARREPERCVVVEATGDVETVHTRIMAAIDERLDSARRDGA